MSLWDMFLPRSEKYDSKEDELAGAFPNERTDLGVHVDICARRFASLRRAVARASEASDGNRRLLWAVLLLLVAGNVIDLKHIVSLF